MIWVNCKFWRFTDEQLIVYIVWLQARYTVIAAKHPQRLSERQQYWAKLERRNWKLSLDAKRREWQFAIKELADREVRRWLEQQSASRKLG